MGRNKELINANKNKKDEFYTTLPIIEAELGYYTDLLRGATVYCNCDDPYRSNFVGYFVENFNTIGLERVIATSYAKKTSYLPLFDEKSPDPIQVSYFFEKRRNDPFTSQERAIGEELIDNPPTRLSGDGDFRSEECLKLLDEADVVITNPPFSLFRPFLTTLFEHNKKFLIIGNQTTATCKNIFPYIKDGKMWFGPSITSGDRPFYVPDDYELNAAGCGIDEDGKRYVKVKSVRWFTNLDHNVRHTPLDLTETYNPDRYPKFDEYDAINVGETALIPKDYYGKMGVPISFLDKFCPEQFEILGIDRYMEDNPHYGRRFHIDGAEKFARVIIRRKQG